MDLPQNTRMIPSSSSSSSSGCSSGISQLWDLIETRGFRVDVPWDLPGNFIKLNEKFTKPNLTKPLKNRDFWAYLSFGT